MGESRPQKPDWFLPGVHEPGAQTPTESDEIKKKRKEGLARGSKTEIKTTKDIPELSDAGMVLNQKELEKAKGKIRFAEGTEKVEKVSPDKPTSETMQALAELKKISEEKKRAEAIEQIRKDIAEEL